MKLVDFGFAAEAKTPSLTDQCGTPAYVAPEILYNQPYGNSLILYFSLSVINHLFVFRQAGGYVVFRCDLVHPSGWIPSFL